MPHGKPFLAVFWTITKQFAVRVWMGICRGFKICLIFFFLNSGKHKNKIVHECNHGSLCIFAAFAAVCDGKFAASLPHLCFV